MKKGYAPGTVMAIPFGDDKHRPMFGGAFIHTSDSRFARAVEAITGAPTHGTICLHDRYE